MSQNRIPGTRDSRYRIYDFTAPTPVYVELPFVVEATLPQSRERAEEAFRSNQGRIDDCSGYNVVTDDPIVAPLDISLTFQRHIAKYRQYLDMLSNPRDLAPWEVNGTAIVPVPAASLGTTLDSDGLSAPFPVPCDFVKSSRLLVLEALENPPGDPEAVLSRYIGIYFRPIERTQGDPNTLSVNGTLFGAIQLDAGNDFSAGTNLFP